MLKSNLDIERFSLNPVDVLYNQMPSEVKNSSYGKKILWHMNKVKKVPLGQMAPAFKVKTINEKIIELRQFQGKNVVLLDFWGSWCFPCRRLTPILRNIYENFHSKGLEIISIAVQDNEADWKNAIALDSMNKWEHILDNDIIMNLY